MSKKANIWIDTVLVLIKDTNWDIRQWNKSNRYRQEIIDYISLLDWKLDFSKDTYNFIHIEPK